MPRRTRSMLRRGTCSRVLVLLALLVATACADVQSGRTGTGNMVDAALVEQPRTSSWVTGQLRLAQADSGKACLLLKTPEKTYVIRSAVAPLTAVAWQTHGSFDESLSGIMRAGSLVVPYTADRAKVRGGLVAASDPVCGKYPTWGFTTVKETAPAVAAAEASPDTPTQVAPIATPSAATGHSDIVEIPRSDLVWKSGTITMVPGNEGEGSCLAFATTAGAYVISSATPKLDAMIVYEGEGINRRTTGLHVHGRRPTGMAAAYGQHAELLGVVSDVTDLQCSAYYDLSVFDWR